MNRVPGFAVAGFILAVLLDGAIAGPVGVDGVLGSEWTGVVPTHVNSDPNAPYTGPDAPGFLNNNVPYDVYYRADSTYLYAILIANGDTSGLNFANVYFNTDLVGGSDFGIEVTNNRAFVPGQGGYYDLTGYLVYAESQGNINHAIEFAMPFSYFRNDPQNILPDATDPTVGIQFRTSQSFGYNGVRGDPVTRFGTVSQAAVNAVPEPATLGLVAFALAGVGITRRRRPA